MPKLQALGKILDQIEGALDHITAAFDIAHENGLPEDIDLFALKKKLYRLHKDLTDQYVKLSTDQTNQLKARRIKKS